MTNKSIVSQMSSDINVGMEEVVSVFVAQYEDNLFAKKKDLSNEIKSTKKDLADLDKRLLSEVDADQYNIKKIPVLNLSSKVDDITVCWVDPNNRHRKNFKSSIRIEVEVKDLDKGNDGYRSTFDKNINLPIAKADVNKHNSMNESIESLNDELVEVMGLIKSVSRKERQVRGRISKKKLEESGFEGLLNDNEMLKLVQL